MLAHTCPCRHTCVCTSKLACFHTLLVLPHTGVSANQHLCLHTCALVHAQTTTNVPKGQIRTCKCQRAHMHQRAHKITQTCQCTCVYTCLWLHTYTYPCKHTWACKDIPAHTCLFVHQHTCAGANKHTCNPLHHGRTRKCQTWRPSVSAHKLVYVPC